MPKPLGLFDSFDNMDGIKPEDIASWLNPASPLPYLENYLANKMLYPQTLPISAQDSKIELAILRQALKVNSPQKITQINPFLSESPFLNLNLKKILIPAYFLNFTPDLTTLVWVFIDGLLLGRKKEDWYEDIWTVVLVGDLDEMVGTVLLPQFEKPSAEAQVDLYGKSYTIKNGNLIVVPCERQKCQILFRSAQGKLLGKNDLLIEVYGGKAGIIVDGRN